MSVFWKSVRGGRHFLLLLIYVEALNITKMVCKEDLYSPVEIWSAIITAVLETKLKQEQHKQKPQQDKETKRQESIFR